jgi:ElaB/YqjD/DUF883 family membrane-anchored ribosome-binding protein
LFVSKFRKADGAVTNASKALSGADCFYETMQTTETFQRAKQATADAYTTAARASRTALQRGVDYVRQNPVKVMLGAVGAGVLIALAIQRRESSWQDRAFRLPIKKMKGWASSAAEQAGEAYERAGELYEDYRDRATEVAGDAMKAVQKSARGLRFWS